MNFAANLKALRGADIHEPAASRLAALKHVTPDFAREHVSRVLEEHRQIGAAIFRIEHNWTLPEKGKPDWPPILINPEDPRPPGYPTEKVDSTVWNFDENVYTLLEYRGAEDVAKRLAALRHVTPQFIRKHMRQAAKHNQDVITALYRIEHNERFPDEWMYEARADQDAEAGVQQLAGRLGRGGGGRV